jgi:hypothetical protein
VRYSAKGAALYALGVLLLVSSVGAGVGLWLAADRAATRRLERERDSVAATASVLETGRARGENRRRYLVYRYEVNGTEYRGRVTLRQRDRRFAEVGSPLEIRYLPRDPRNEWVPGYEPDGVPVWVAFVVPPVLSLSSWPIFCALRRQRRLLMEGRPAEARAIGSKKIHNGHAYVYRVEYEFRTLSGARKVKKVDSSKDVPVGRGVTVIYDRDDPARSAVYPMSLVCVK